MRLMWRNTWPKTIQESYRGSLALNAGNILQVDYISLQRITHTIFHVALQRRRGPSPRSILSASFSKEPNSSLGHGADGKLLSRCLDRNLRVHCNSGTSTFGSGLTRLPHSFSAHCLPFLLPQLPLCRNHMHFQMPHSHLQESDPLLPSPH